VGLDDLLRQRHPALLWGVALGNLLMGVPIDADKQFVGGFFDLLNPYALVAGLASLTAFITHGAIFLHLKSTDPICERAMRAIKVVGPVATAAVFLFVLATYAWTDAFARLGVNPGLVPVSRSARCSRPAPSCTARCSGGPSA
jgi:cytochrome bd ubiquinol oxidase subunit II